MFVRDSCSKQLDSDRLAAYVPDVISISRWDQIVDDDRPFIVLTETKFSFRCIPVWIGTLLTGLGSKKTHVIMFSP